MLRCARSTCGGVAEAGGEFAGTLCRRFVHATLTLSDVEPVSLAEHQVGILSMALETPVDSELHQQFSFWQQVAPKTG